MKRFFTILLCIIMVSLSAGNTLAEGTAAENAPQPEYENTKNLINLIKEKGWQYSFEGKYNGEDSAEMIRILVSYGKTAQMMHIFIEKNNLYGAIYLKVLNYSLYSENMERIFRTVNDINTNSNLCVGYVDEEYQCVAVRASLLLPPDSDIAGQILMEAIYRTYNTAQDMYKALTEYIKYIVP